MTTPDESDLTRLTRLDPTLGEHPPAPGTARYDTILEKAMTQILEPTAVPVTKLPPPWRRRRVAVTAGIAASVLAVGITAGALAGHAPSASAAVLTAATHTGEVTSLRGTTRVTGDGGDSTATIAASGDRIMLSSTDDLGVDNLTVIGEYGWESNANSPKPVKQKLPPGARLAPFATSTRDVVRAALSGADVDRKGDDQVRGTTTTHYHLALTSASLAALNALPATERAWFELEGLKSGDTVDVWIGGDLIHRVVVQAGGRHSTTEFYDFNAKITINPPAGPA